MISFGVTPLEPQRIKHCWERGDEKIAFFKIPSAEQERRSGGSLLKCRRHFKFDLRRLLYREQDYLSLACDFCCISVTSGERTEK